MASVVAFNPADPIVAGRVIAHRVSASGAIIGRFTNKLRNPDLTGLFVAATKDTPASYTVPLVNWKESGGSIVEMSAGEKAALVTDAAAKRQAIVARTIVFSDEGSAAPVSPAKGVTFRNNNGALEVSVDASPYKVIQVV